MFEQEMGANDITVEDIENFLNGNGAVTPAANNQESSDESHASEDETPVTETQAFARRLKEATSKARSEERESIAKSLGYDSYANMQKRREEDMLKDRGLDPDDVSPVIEELVKKRLAEDPRLREIESYRDERVNMWAQKELAELNELTGGRITTLSDVPADVIELWKTKGSLKAAYIELQGETLIREMRTGVESEHSRGSTGHLTSPRGTPASHNSRKRPFTDEEKRVYKLFNPDVTDEQLSKMMKNK